MHDDLVFRQFAAQAGAHGIEKIADVAPFPVDGKRAGFDPRHVEKILHKAVQAARGQADIADKGVPHRSVRERLRVRKRARCAGDDRNRGPQFVRGRAQERFAETVRTEVEPLQRKRQLVEPYLQLSRFVKRHDPARRQSDADDAKAMSLRNQGIIGRAGKRQSFRVAAGRFSVLEDPFRHGPLLFGAGFKELDRCGSRARSAPLSAG